MKDNLNEEQTTFSDENYNQEKSIENEEALKNRDDLEDRGDPLENLRKIDKKEKMKKLKKMMGRLKALQKEINVAKYECEGLIRQVGFEDRDVKRIIDFIGEMSDVKVTNKSEIEEKTREWLEGEKEGRETSGMISSFSKTFPSDYTITNPVKSDGTYYWMANRVNLYDNGYNTVMTDGDNKLEI